MDNENLNIRELLDKAIKRWYLFLIIFLITIIVAFFYLETTPNTYQSNALLLIKDDKSSGEVVEEAIFSDLGLFGSRGNIANEILSIGSSPLLRKVVTNLNLQYECFEKERFRTNLLYDNPPIMILNWEPVDTNLTFEGSIVNWNSRDGSYQLEVEENVYKGEFGKVLIMSEGKLTLSKGIISENDDREILLRIRPVNGMVNYFKSNLTVDMEGVESSIIKLTLEDRSALRAKDVLENLINYYNDASKNEKNRVFRNSINLINERIAIIDRELSTAEENVEFYKRRFNTLELTAEGNQLITEISDFDRKITDAEIQIEILNSIEEFLEKNENNFEFVPTNSSLTNLTLVNQVATFNKLLADRARLRSDLGPAHPDLILIEKQIQNLRGTIIENIKTIKRDIQIVRGSVQNQKNNIESKISSLPRRERELVQLVRQKEIKENLYLYLLQKREESVLSLAVTVSTGKVIEPPQVAGKPIKPRKTFILATAALLGLLLPLGFVYFIEVLDTKIRSEEDIQKVLSIPIGGMIARDKKKENIVIKEGSRTAVSETFRLLRANLAYINPGADINTLMVTSSMSGEGKSFIALNLAMTIALTGKKTILVELDMRKPKQVKYLEITKGIEVGAVNYLINNELKVSDVIIPSGHHQLFDIIPCGPLPPNPGELILSPRLSKLIAELKEIYDFIIIDSPPVGLVSDPLQIGDLVEATIYVVRMDFTRKKQLDIIGDIADNNKLPHPLLVINSVPLTKSGANYGYGSGYYYDR